jgi:hypothetical protein
MDLDRDCVINWLATAAPPGSDIIRLKGAECCACAEGINSTTQGSVGLVVLVKRWGFHGHDDSVILIEFRWSGAPTQEGPTLVFPIGVLSVCA